jgi:hypothetical protein
MLVANRWISTRRIRHKMRLPRMLLGTSKRVAGETRKIVTRLRKKQSREQILSSAEMVELDDHPRSLIALDRVFSMLGGVRNRRRS